MRVLHWAERKSGSSADRVDLVELVRGGATTRDAAARTGLPIATVEGVRTFYSLLDGPAHRACTGTACSYARDFHDPGEPEVRCAGRCYAAPCELDLERDAEREHPIPIRVLAPEPIALRRIAGSDDAAPLPPDPTQYALPAPARILEIVEASGVRGRGGAAYPTAAKWRVAANTPADLRYVVANGDEGDPGSFVDRLLLERDPHAILAGLNACAAAIGARRGIVYVRGEYPRAARVMRAAIEQARPFFAPGFEVRVHVGAGSYVCGEETALLRAIEGLRAEPSPRPPYPAQVGLHGKPTVVQNVETLANIPWVLRVERKPETKLFSLSGAVATPCAVEAPFGTPLRALLERAGGGPRSGARWKLALIGGPMGTVLPESAFDTPLTFSALPGMGHAGIVVFDERVSARRLAEHLFAFAAAESCGNCTPCRAGTAQLASRPDAGALNRLLDTLEHGSLCGFGAGVPRPIRDLLRWFPDELFAMERR